MKLFRGHAGWWRRRQRGPAMGNTVSPRPTSPTGEPGTKLRQGGNSCSDPRGGRGTASLGANLEPPSDLPPEWGPALEQGPRVIPLGMQRSLEDFRGRWCTRGGIPLSGSPSMGPPGGSDSATHRASRSSSSSSPGAGRGGLLREPCCRAGLGVPDLCLLPVPGTVGPLDGKFLADRAPGQQFE